MASEVTVIEWSGDIDRASAPALAGPLVAALADPAVTVVVVDLARVTFLDSVGIGVLVQARTQSLSTGTRLTLRAVPPPVRRVVEISGIEAMFEFDDPHPHETNDPATLPATTPLPATADRSFDELAALTARLLGVPTALVTFVDERQQVMPGASGLRDPWNAARSVPLTHSLCQYVVSRSAPLSVVDARLDPLFAKSPAIHDMDLSAYLGVPIADPAGQVVGAVCAIDSAPHEWRETDLDTLRLIARMCSAELRLRIGRALGEHGLAGRLAAIDAGLGEIAASADFSVAERVLEVRSMLTAVLTELRL